MRVCLVDQASCGCCLMQKKMQRMESFFNMTVEELSEKLTKSKTALNDMRASRSAFSVALNHSENYGCFGPFAAAELIPYRHVFLNLGDGYSADTGTFTAPRSGVYSLAVTAYSNGSPAGGAAAAATTTTGGTAANLLVNGQVVASLQEADSPDREDSATVVVAVKLKAGDAVAVSLPEGYLVCDDRSYFNTFTGFLLYPCEVLNV
ncbi:complement C1q-like protein 4 [Cyclopterus lumpus]|uniref:complement C1q-like protein 4 n=1 Tax=Cyclopterus lumpus TaxID=8103 RepID=UPI00148615F4|nr:complement C1q-like protein 4 [Cyclopterus lumpus]